jgi:hypothetical protein
MPAIGIVGYFGFRIQEPRNVLIFMSCLFIRYLSRTPHDCLGAGGLEERNIHPPQTCMLPMPPVPPTEPMRRPTRCVYACLSPRSRRNLSKIIVGRIKQRLDKKAVVASTSPGTPNPKKGSWTSSKSMSGSGKFQPWDSSIDAYYLISEKVGYCWRDCRS